MLLTRRLAELLEKNALCLSKSGKDGNRSPNRLPTPPVRHATATQPSRPATTGHSSENVSNPAAVV